MALLAPYHDALGLKPVEALAAIRAATSYAEVRDALSLDFRTFNAALAELDPPQPPLTHPELHEDAFARFIDTVKPRLVERLRERYKPLAEAGQDVSGYAAGRRMDGLTVDDAWLALCRVPSLPMMRLHAQTWLEVHGAEPDLDSDGELPPADISRRASTERLKIIVGRAAPLIHAWCRIHGVAVPAPWASAPLLEATAALDASGLADLIEPDDAKLLAIAATGAGWPDGMRLSLDLADLRLTADDLPPGAGGSAGRGGHADQSTIVIGGATVLVGFDHLAQIAEAAVQTLTAQFLAQNGKTDLAALAPVTPGRKRQPGGAAVVGAHRLSEDLRTAIGLVGEIAARAWLEHRYERVLWRSGYAVLLNSDPEASDSWGYDYEVVRPHGPSLMYEVKATRDPAGGLAEFEMGQSEIDAAQEHSRSERYRILLITSVLDPSARQVHELPSPYSAKGRGRYRPAGRGLRYQCLPS